MDQPFYISLPVWIVVYKDVFEKEGLPDSIVTGNHSDGPFFPFFTDRDLAERFAAEIGSTISRPHAITSKESFLSILSQMKEVEINDVAADFGKERGAFWRTEEFIELVQQW